VNITLTPEQVEIIQQKLQSGRYKTVDDLLTQALLLLDDWDECSPTEDSVWIEATRKKVDAAIASLEANGGTDGETVVTQMLNKFHKTRKS
jgi:antitoxin ParD1/3/4